MFFFFKQKTAYEMRISDWSSDVCSSDLSVVHHQQVLVLERMAITLRDFSHARGPDMRNEAFRADLRRQIAQIPVTPGRVDRYKSDEIGRASCKERVCQYV